MSFEIKISELIKQPHKLEEFVDNNFSSLDNTTLYKLIPYVTSPNLLFKIAERLHTKLPKEKEEILLNGHPSIAFRYTIDVKKERWVELEERIKHYSELAVEYAKSILRGRFKEAEPTIISNSKALNKYIKLLREFGELGEFYNDYPSIRRKVI